MEGVGCFPIDRPGGDAWKYHDAWSHLWRTDHQARCGRDFFEKKGGRSWKNPVDIQTPTKWPAVIVVEITVHESIISHIPILRCPKKSEEYLLRRIYLNIGIKTKPTNATHRNRQTLRWGYDPNLYDYRGDMPEVMTDAKLGHVQEMLESIPYLDCCERQQRSFGLFFFFWRSGGGFIYLLGRGQFQVGLGGQLICAFQLLIRFFVKKGVVQNSHEIYPWSFSNFKSSNCWPPFAWMPAGPPRNRNETFCALYQIHIVNPSMWIYQESSEISGNPVKTNEMTSWWWKPTAEPQPVDIQLCLLFCPFS